MPWVQVHIPVEKAAAQAVELLLETIGAISITLTDAGDEPQLEPAPGEERIWSETVVTALFESETDWQQLRSALETALDQLNINATPVIEVLEEQEWERAWLDDFKPMRFGERLWVVPRGLQLPDEATDPVVMTLDPGLAFGTGTHPTSALCLEWLDQADLPGKDVIDFGCGSGILAIAALLLGARQATGIDHDPQALIGSEQNAEENGVLDRLVLQNSDTPPQKSADIVMANILASVLIDLSTQLASLPCQGGRIALSGILADQAEDVRAAFDPYFRLEATQNPDDWVLITGTKR
jgi:LSU ribosomal protein L11P methyltransferase (EC 2.1.1.-)